MSRPSTVSSSFVSFSILLLIFLHSPLLPAKLGSAVRSKAEFLEKDQEFKNTDLKVFVRTKFCKDLG